MVASSSLTKSHEAWIRFFRNRQMKLQFIYMLADDDDDGEEREEQKKPEQERCECGCFGRR
jgi:hypothetical protein